MKLTKYYNAMDKVLISLQETLEVLEDKIYDIQENADMKCRDLTEREEERIEAIEEQMSAIRDSICCLEEAINYIDEYCE